MNKEVFIKTSALEEKWLRQNLC